MLFVDYFQLIFQPVHNAFFHISAVQPIETVKAQFPEVLTVVPAALRLELGNFDRAVEIHLHAASPGYQRRISQRVLVSLEMRRHFLRRTEIKFIGVKAHAVGLSQNGSCLYAEKHILHFCIFLIYIVAVVGRGKGYSRLIGKPVQLR